VPFLRKLSGIAGDQRVGDVGGTEQIRHFQAAFCDRIPMFKTLQRLTVNQSR
jgi:hypothetical protein